SARTCASSETEGDTFDWLCAVRDANSGITIKSAMVCFRIFIASPDSIGDIFSLKKVESNSGYNHAGHNDRLLWISLLARQSDCKKRDRAESRRQGDQQNANPASRHAKRAAQVRSFSSQDNQGHEFERQRR